MKDTTGTVKSASCLDLHLKNDGKGKLWTKLFDKPGDFSFRVVNFSFVCGNIPSAPAYFPSFHITTHTLGQSLL